MLIATQAKSIAGTQKYFDKVLTQGDYYLGQEVNGQWHGKGAELLGLEEGAMVTKEQFCSLLAGLHPLTEAKLAQRTRKDRRPGVDFTYSVPKSVSIAWALKKDDRILEAMREAVHETMARDVEPLMCRRVRDGAKAATKDRKRTGKLIYADFLHKTSRPVEGKTDPHLHVHAFCLNWTHDEGKHYAAEMEEIVRSRPYLQAAFEARLAGKLRRFGYQVEATEYTQGGKRKKGWEIVGIDRSTIEKFSQRTQQVEAFAEEHGVTDEVKKAKLGLKTREKKDQGATVETLRKEWENRLTPHEREQLEMLGQGAIGKETETVRIEKTRQALQYALEHHLYRQSTVEKQAVIATALEKGLTLTPEEVATELDRQEVIQAERDVRGAKRQYVTTPEVLEAEERMIAYARDGRGTRLPIARQEHHFKREWLNDQQKEAVRHVLNSRDTVTGVMGGAGTGKSSLMQEAAEAIEASDKKLFVFAPSTGAKEVLEEKGFAKAQTVEHLLRNEKLHPELQDQVLWVDEAGLLDTRSMLGIFDIAKAQNARVVLSGDTRQHSSPRRGEAARILEQEAGLSIARVEKIQRQRGRYKEAIELIGRGNEIVDRKQNLTGLAAGFELLDKLGKVKEVSTDDRHALLAEEYLKAKGKETPLVVSPTHAEGRAVTQHIRNGLREQGAIGKEDRELVQLKSLNLTEAERKTPECYRQPGLVVQFHQNVKGGYVRGERYRVEVDQQGEVALLPIAGGAKKPVPIETPGRFEVYREEKLGLAVGDKVRFSLGGTATDRKRRISNGRIDEVAGFDKRGNLKLKSGMTVSKDYGHLDHGFVITSQTAQGKDAKKAIAAMGSQSLPAINAKQLYVTASRGKEDVTLYVDDKAAIRRAIQGSGQQLSATELVKDQKQTSQQTQQRRPSQQVVSHVKRRQSVIERAREWWQRRGAGKSSVRGAGRALVKQPGFTNTHTRHQNRPQPRRS
ncbi:MobF family relaxase [Adhaeretor mobilis]|uniref:Multifunctional conjugation protein TraI n=1 Tax=Adhaeretor mobilis TaxID=1930276 RepID=A0A517MWT9_9BACT|nr:MobF family relaxase [Adhaeretor mobilis]QDS99329.1 Multifunctional conjugation protein TraI [Adhaeretor mobilis]